MEIDAFGYGIGLNPPIDIHIPDAEELAENIRKSQSETIEKIIRDVIGKDRS